MTSQAADAKKPSEAEREIESRLMRARVLRCMHEGTSDDDAARELGVDLAEYREARAQAISDEGRRISALKPEEVFAEYLVQMRVIIVDLMKVRRMASRKGSFGPAVQALKTAADVLDRSIGRGQELGVINTNAKPTMHMHAHIVSQLDNRALRSLIVHEVDTMHRLVGESGDADFLSLTEGDIAEADVVNVESTDVIPQTDEPSRGVRGDPNATGKPPFARGGLSKVAGGKAVHRKPREDDDDIDAILGGG
jgi:hypothetical protein